MSSEEIPCRRGSIADYEGFEIPKGYGVIYEYFIPSICKSYIGQTTNLHRRHFAHLRRGPLSAYLRSDDYILNVLETVEVRKLDHMERVYIARLHTQYPNGLNVRPGGRKDDLPPMTDFSGRMEWVFSDHEHHGEGIDFKAVALKDKAAGMYILIPKDVVRRMHLRTGDELDVRIDYTKVYQ